MVARTFVLACMVAVVLCGVAVAQIAEPLVLLDGESAPLEAPAVLKDGHVLVWVRDLAHIAGGQVYVRSTDGAAVIRRDAVWTAFSPGKAEAEAPGRIIPLPVAVERVNDRVMIPLEAGCRALGIGCSVGQRIVATISRPGSSPSRGGRRPGSIAGRATFNGKGKAGIHLRLVREDGFTFVPGAHAVTGADGEYEFWGIPPGAYHVYAYVGDNPRYFNRHAPPVRLQGGAVTVADLELGMVLEPLVPQPGAAVEREGAVLFRWNDCPGAAEYTLTILDDATGGEVFSTRAKGPLASVPGSRLSPGGTYRWHVRATGADGSFLGGTPGTGGQPWRFRVR
ncbi:MAG: hypothetical protein JSV65_09450 [Armatimonadota bacterium]|nr:MAG: hypothetical protein JSV65_09450 [Armatimonadota bacterium]